MPVLCGLDLATRSGVAILDGETLVHVAAFRPKGDTDSQIFHGFRLWLRPLLIGHGVEAVAIEQPLPTNIETQDKRPNAKPGEKRNPITMATYLRLYGLRAHAIEICEALNIDCREVHQSTWRKSFTGNGRANKDDVLKLARQLVPDLKSKDASDALGCVWWLRGELSPLGKTLDLFREAS